MPEYKPCGCVIGFYCEHGTTEKQVDELKRRHDELTSKGIVNLTDAEHEEIRNISRELPYFNKLLCVVEGEKSPSLIFPELRQTLKGGKA